MNDDILDTDIDTTGETWNESGAVCWLIGACLIMFVISCGVVFWLFIR